ncbi:MAG: tetratricopeptide repeat protein [Cyanobacteria bacterium]|nr:tetratricopeptide repeat protein [Cyanobacteriota bacterium]
MPSAPDPKNTSKPNANSPKVKKVSSDQIDAGAVQLEPPKITPVTSRNAGRTTETDLEPIYNGNGNGNEKNGKESDQRPAPSADPSTHADKRALARQGGVTTQWETPYNRPAYETPENIKYSRLASQYLQQGRIEDAERLYSLGLEVAERTLSADHPGLVQALEDLAGFYVGNGKFVDAEPLVSRLLELRIQTLSPDNSLLIRTVDSLAEIYEKSDQIAQAQSLYKFLLARQEEILGRNSETVAFTLSRLAECYLRQERFSACEALLIRILEIQESLHGRSSIEISNTLQDLSRIYHLQRRYDKAAEMLERLLHILESIHGENGLAVASCLLKLADLLTEVNMIHEAEPLYRRAQAIYQRSYGKETAAHSAIRKKLTNLDIIRKTTETALPVVPDEQRECNSWPAFTTASEEPPQQAEVPKSITAHDGNNGNSKNGNGGGPSPRATNHDVVVLTVPSARPAVVPQPVARPETRLMPEPFPTSRKRRTITTQNLSSNNS